MKIVILEDNDFLRKIIYDSIKPHFPGGHIISFTNGEDGITEINKSPVDIAVIDINLPGINGLTVTQQVREKWPNAFIIIYTSYDIPEYREKSIESGANCFLSKDKNKPDDLIRLIKSVNS